MRKNTGFTLIELLITMVIGALLLAIGLPAMKSFIQEGRMTVVANEMVAALNAARSGAIRENTFACVCPSTDVTAAAPSCAASSSWESGWITFVDYNGNCTYETGGAPQDILLKVYDGTQTMNSITVRNSDASINGFNNIRFNARGVTQSINGGIQKGTFKICDERGLSVLSNGDSDARGVVVSASGTVRSTRNAAAIGACP